MTEHDTALALDRALDGERGLSLNGAESLVITAHAIQTLFDRQQAAPSEEFIMHLESRLILPTVTPPVIPSAVEGPPAAAVSRPRPTPRPARLQTKQTRLPYWWVAIAAAFILLLSAGGAYLFGPFGDPPVSEPSAIPAAFLGTVEASPAPAVMNWTIAPPEGSTRLITPGLVSNDRVFTVFATNDGNTIAQAVDLRTGKVFWSGPLGIWQNLLVSTAGDLLLATATVENGSALTAYDGDTGTEVWQIELEQRPVGLLVQDDRVLVLGSGNGLDAFDLNSRQSLWQTDLSQYDQAAADDAGMNKYFNMTGSRLAATDGIVGAIVSNGRLVGVDVTDGTVQWADERTTNAATIVMVVDGKFVVTAAGSDMQGYDYDGAAGTPIPESNRCQAAIAPRNGSVPGAIRPNGAGADSFDSATGESPWGVESNRPTWIWKLDASNLVAVVSPGWDIVNDRPQNMFPCKIDGATGAISDLAPSLLADVVLDSNSDTPTGMAGFPDGGTFVIPDIDPTVAASLPHVESDGSRPVGASWVRTVDGLTLVVVPDGTLMAMPATASDTPSTDATPATPVEASTNTGWIVPGPEGDEAESEGSAPVVDDGRIVRSFYTATAAYHSQAVDMTTGDVLWDKPLDVRGEVMASSGDLLLVGGRVGALLKDFSLVAIDQATGEDVWRATLSELPVGIAVDGDRAFVLGSGNHLDAIDLAAGKPIYSSDIGGDSKPVDTLRSRGSNDSLAINGKILVAVLADGSLAGADLDTGAGQWWNLRHDGGNVRIAFVDGALLAIDHDENSYYLPEEPSESSGSASPVTVASPVTAECLGSPDAASPVATTEADASKTHGPTFMRLDPSTGTAIWTLASPNPLPGEYMTDTGLIYLISTAENAPTDRAQLAFCAIDSSTGQSSTIDRMTDFSGSAFVLTVTDQPDQEFIAANLDGDQLITAPAFFDPGVTGPTVTIDFNAGGGTRWFRIYDDAIYLSRLDGGLQKIPIPES